MNSACKMWLEPTVDRETLKCGTLGGVTLKYAFVDACRLILY